MANGGIIGPVNPVTSGGSSSQILTTKTGSATHTMHPATTYATIALVAAGGAGGSAPAEGGGGGGGGGVRIIRSAVTGGTGYPITIGAGGAGAHGPSNPGDDGGNSSIVIGSCTHTAEGGGGGASGTASKVLVVEVLVVVLGACLHAEWLQVIHLPQIPLKVFQVEWLDKVKLLLLDLQLQVVVVQLQWEMIVEMHL